MKKIVALCLAVSFLTGCAVNLPFNNRLSYGAIKELRQSIHNTGAKINISWEPSGFPERIDVHGASGFVGSASNTRIPTGIALSSRIEEAISTYADITPDGRNLVIKVDDAQSKFEFASGIVNVTPTIDVADVTFKATFNLDGDIWTKEYKSRLNDPTIGGTSETGLLEKAWDTIAVQVATDVAKHLRQ
ncbi:hypothetical protein KCE64_004814 [Salmonella enterica subsp. enterica serovar Hvittingfoss]|nr:hypothetical protein [Salmonella enterica subsp. arizonae]ECJ5905510.1 hypothetical protein [Salmonella enterica subsp. diarizonae]EHL2773984.1 hypothetical protein [Salmonella enterica subsp. enterica serovar Hvittingfoss]EHL2852305.1 hypothetical protein [Salmonella enterica subsp. enterica serovar Hvittingfoss]